MTMGCVLILALAVHALPLRAEAQQAGKMPQIGYLNFRPGPNLLDEAFLLGLHDLGWSEGKNIAIEYRWGAGKQRLPVMVEELVDLKVDIIVANGAGVVEAARKTPTKIPVVMTTAADAVENGLVSSLSRPSGNITGLSWQYSVVHTKLLEVLHETLPRVTRVAFLWEPGSPTYARTYKKVQAAAPGLKLTIQSLALRHPEELADLLATATREQAGALVVMGRMYNTYGRQIAAFAAKNRMPVFSISTPSVAKHFGLLAYAPYFPDMYRRAATYVDKILKGANPADLPVQRPVKFDLVVNLKTAKQLGITIPSSILYRANRVIRRDGK